MSIILIFIMSGYMLEIEFCCHIYINYKFILKNEINTAN